MTRQSALRVCALLSCLLVAPGADAQSTEDEATRPSFSLSSNQVFTSREAPFVFLTFRHITRLDFRVYKVRDPFQFFASLRDPHQLGSEEPVVPQERSWIERISRWKADQRQRARRFLRDQVSREYRQERRAAADKAVVAQRVTLQASSFAQVPLLNPDQLVTSWREILPDYRDPELRRIPLEVKTPGVYLVEAVNDRRRAYTIVIISDVGLVTKTSPGQLVMFAADRFTGEPTAGCDVRVLANRARIGQGETSADGIAEIALPDGAPDDVIGVARCGDRVTVTDAGAWTLSEPSRTLVGLIYTDKPLYRPGHTVHIKGILRWRQRDALDPFDASQVEISLADVNDRVVLRRPLPVDAFGAVHTSFEIPLTAALGPYAIRIASGDAQATSAFEVQEYRKPEFEVTVTPASRFVVQRGEVSATIQARYYFGQPVANARVRYVVSRQPYYSPYAWDDTVEGSGSTYWYGGGEQLEGELRLDPQGRGEITIPLPADAHDYTARIEARVVDASSREVSDSSLVHATVGPFLLSTRTTGYVFRTGGQVETSTRALDYTGAPHSGVRVSLVLERITYPEGYGADSVATKSAQTEVTTDAQGVAAARLTLPNDAGTYRITSRASVGASDVTDQAWLWVPGPDESTAGGDDRYLELLADRRSYQPGDTAHLMVRGASVSGPILVTKEGQHVSWYRVLRPTPSDAIDVPVDEGDIGDVYVNVTYMRDGRLSRAERRVSVPPTDRTLQVTLTADDPVARPQEPGGFTVQVVDAAGQPVEAQVSVGVIDEAVYAVRADDTPDPVRFFHRREYSHVSTVFSREFYFTGYSGDEQLQLASKRRRRPFTLADFKGDRPLQPQIRKEFPDAIYWLADLVTDGQGRGRIAIKYPDALTTWRLTARAVTRDTHAGASVVRTTTTKDLIVRVTTPRFLTQGDEVVLPTIVHNYLAEPRETEVTLDATGLEPLSGGTAERITRGSLESGGERRDDWRFAARLSGTAVITTRAKTETDSDAIELSVPVRPFGLRREEGRSGSLQGAGEQTADLTIPSTANDAGRQITVSLAPSLAGSLLGALEYLNSYPYGCTEQTLSSFLPNLLVTRTLTRLKLAPTERLSSLDRQVSQGLGRLADYQHDDGGWGWWNTDENHPFMTAYALYGLTEARAAGYRIDDDRMSNGARALARMYAEFPRVEPDLKAYMAYVLARAGGSDETISWSGEKGSGTYAHANARDELWSARARMSAYGRALLLLTLDAVKDARGDDLANTLLGEARTEGDLSWWRSERDPLLFDEVDTSVEATALAVQALAPRGAREPLLDRAMRWLVLNRTGGYWSSTKQTAMAIYGLLALLEARNERPAPVAVDVFVNDVLAGSRELGPAQLTEPDSFIVSAPASPGVNRVRVVTRGAGALYWSATARYFDAAGAAARHGTRELAITRQYARVLPVQRAGLTSYREEPLAGDVSPGDVLSVRLTVAGSKDWRYLVIEDPLPAGVEAIQDTAAYPLERPAQSSWWWGSRVEYRDERTVFFQQTLEDGRYEFRYLVKVISAGQFRAAPAQIAPMYVPGVAASSEPHVLNVVLPAGKRP